MVIKLGEKWLKPRQMGVALTTTVQDDLGRALFETEPGVYEEFEVKAIEYFRQYHEVWVVDEHNGITEHTPQELKFEDALGVPHRASEDNPLPVSMGRKAITHTTLLCTTLGNTELIAAPDAGYKIRVHYFSYSSKHSVVADVAMRFGAAGELRHRHILAPDGGNVPVNLTDSCWEGGDAEALNAYLTAAYADGVIFNIAYTIEAVS